jgi:hypothetical protein
MRDFNRLQRKTWKSDIDLCIRKIKWELRDIWLENIQAKIKYCDDISLKSNYS